MIPEKKRLIKGFIFSLNPPALTKSIICVNGWTDWLNNEMSPVNSKAKHLDFSSSPISFKHSTRHRPENSGLCFLLKATVIRCKSVPFHQSCPVKKAILQCDIQDKLKHKSALPSDHLIGPWPPFFTDDDWTSLCPVCMLMLCNSLKKCCSPCPLIMHTTAASISTNTAFICSVNWNHEERGSEIKALFFFFFQI